MITPENFMMIRWREYCEKGVKNGQTDGQTDRQDGRTDWTIHRAASSQLKITVVKTRTVFDLDMNNASASYWTRGAITTFLYQSRTTFLYIVACGTFSHVKHQVPPNYDTGSQSMPSQMFWLKERMCFLQEFIFTFVVCHAINCSC